MAKPIYVVDYEHAIGSTVWVYDPDIHDCHDPYSNYEDPITQELRWCIIEGIVNSVTYDGDTLTYSITRACDGLCVEYPRGSIFVTEKDAKAWRVFSHISTLKKQVMYWENELKTIKGE